MQEVLEKHASKSKIKLVYLAPLKTASSKQTALEIKTFSLSLVKFFQLLHALHKIC